MAELSDSTHEQIEHHCADGDQYAEAGDFSAALRCYGEAWKFVPEPKTDWEASTWILAAIGDANFLSGDYGEGRENLEIAVQCPDGLGNPFIHLRLGQCQYELGEVDHAADELARAYMGAGTEIFESELPKYLDFLKSRLKEPEGGW